MKEFNVLIISGEVGSELRWGFQFSLEIVFPYDFH
jgi:hypothetical protein